MNKSNIHGLRLVGTVSNPYVNHGELLPLYEPITPEGRPSINTVEGWNALCEAQERKNELYRRKLCEG